MVYGCCMSRTNIDINDDLLDIVMRRFGVRTKTEAVDIALRHLSGQPMTIDQALQMRGARAIDTLPNDTPPAATPPADSAETRPSP